MKKHRFQGWAQVALMLQTLTSQESTSKQLNAGQKASLLALAKRLPDNGVIIADEVGMGKTRIAAMLVKAVAEAGGRVAILVPPGLGYQWADELKTATAPHTPPILRSLWQYLQAWNPDAPDTPWFSHSVVLISHTFVNWRLGDNTPAWRWALLPELYAQWRKQAEGRFPRGFHDNDKLRDPWVKNAADAIVSAIAKCSKQHPARQRLQELTESTPWPGALQAGAYKRDATLRPKLAQAVGLGLGTFDLVVIDEAHKSRGISSGLNQLLDRVILQSARARRLAMTATPIELDAAQWQQMLERIQLQLPDDQALGLSKTIDHYMQSAALVRCCPGDVQTREQFRRAAVTFQRALAPYLLRRDKREDSAVTLFAEKTNAHHHTYRSEEKASVDAAQLPPQWKQAVCAAEALSFVATQADAPLAQRLRLSFGNGHGIAALLDHSLQDEGDSNEATAEDKPLAASNGPARAQMPNDKRRQRVDWWMQRLLNPFQQDPGRALFEHPALLKAVEVIEDICLAQDEKVLVFGRFTRPLRALVQLLNAREMLRRLDQGRFWPQSQLAEDDWPALYAAHRQLQRPEALKKTALQQQLQAQYQSLENQRQRMRAHLLEHLRQGFEVLDPKPNAHIQRLFAEFEKSASAATHHESEPTSLLALLARALHELLGQEHAQAAEYAQAFIELMEAACDLDAQETLDSDETGLAEHWSDVQERLQHEYGAPLGGFARLMYGGTPQPTRRFLQLAFNRPNSHPKVLVAQSLVGREGLNLHRACRTVLLLHPEWNPGVVEQQIGRIDRMGSLWERQLFERAEKEPTAPDEWPRIRVISVVFDGTYDTYNWEVLHQRWDDLRSQLHGIVIAPRMAQHNRDDPRIVEESNSAAPNFSPYTATHPQKPSA